MNTSELLFSYGTLQTPEVQLETFGRHLGGTPDALLGYQLQMVAISDPQVVELSGESHHPIAIPTGDEASRVSGMVFAITLEELAHADGYEVSDYQRVMGKLDSGKQAWVYVSAKD